MNDRHEKAWPVNCVLCGRAGWSNDGGGVYGTEREALDAKRLRDAIGNAVRAEVARMRSLPAPCNSDDGGNGDVNFQDWGSIEYCASHGVSKMVETSAISVIASAVLSLRHDMQLMLPRVHWHTSQDMDLADRIEALTKRVDDLSEGVRGRRDSPFLRDHDGAVLTVDQDGMIDVRELLIPPGYRVRVEEVER